MVRHMPKRRLFASALVCVMSTLIAGCGTRPPKLAEAWQARDVSQKMVLDIKRNIYCETIAAIREINKTDTSFGKLIPDDYGIQLQLTLSVTEGSAFAPGLTATRTLSSVLQSGEDVSRNLVGGVSAVASSTATRTDTSYTYWQVGQIAGDDKKSEFCKPDWPLGGGSLLLSSDLGIKNFLEDNVTPVTLLHSSKPLGKKKPEKVDIYSYSLKFAVVTSGSLNSTFKMVTLSGGGVPILNLNRTRTQELILTFGPTGPDGFQPSQVSLSQHLNTELSATLSRD
jgi:hypothetical protein